MLSFTASGLALLQWRSTVEENSCMDGDLTSLTHEQLIVEVKRLRAAIRDHRDSTGHALCWHHPNLWGLLPESFTAQPTVPDWPQFLRGCVQYRQSLDEQLPAALGVEPAALMAPAD